MTELFERAVVSARLLPADTQDEIARILLALTGDQQPVYRFTPEEAAEQDAADAEEAQGDFASEGEIRAIWAKHGL